MAGNVAEWTATTRQIKEGDRVLTVQVIKGGSFMFPLERARCWQESYQQPEVVLVDVGFRCARDAPSK
jgi:formylglycine-generating enzyme required for sulfatase activity